MMRVEGFHGVRVFVGIVKTANGNRVRLEIEDDDRTLFDVQPPAAGRYMTKTQVENLIEALITMTKAWGGDGE